MKNSTTQTGAWMVLALLAGSAQAQGGAAAPALERLEVVGTTPLPGVGQSRNEIPAPVQVMRAADIERSGALDLSDFLARSMDSVHVNNLQGNPLQMDVNYRGFTASPLLGTPQGLSVYMDGVRLNQPFGDVVSWDLIPRQAISSITLMPGSNPVFGLNTLGGAISLQTKDGRSFAGTTLSAGTGSALRRSFQMEHGGSNAQGLHWYGTSNVLQEQGWREDSPSRVGQVFGKLGWNDARTDLSLTLAHAGNQLHGNGLQEQGMLARDFRSVYTKPDVTDNRSWFMNLAGRRELSESRFVSGNAYFRTISTSTFNGDVNEGSLDQNTGANATTAPWAVINPFPSARCLSNVAQGAAGEPGEKCNALLNTTRTDQRNYGISGQVTFLDDLAGRDNQFVLGAGYDASRSTFLQATQLGYLNPDRSVTGVNAFADGVNGGNVDGVPLDNRVDLAGTTRTMSLYAMDTLALRKGLHLTVSGRFNQTVVRNRDGIPEHAGTVASLSGDHRFSRFNPAIGLTWSPTPRVNTWLGYNEGSRAPTPIELGCANPDNPCKLPNAMAGDPPLRQVVTKTIELGARGTTPSALRWSLGLFRAVNHDDILFVAAPDQSSYGYFGNFDKTRRQGLEASLSGAVSALRWGASYTLLDATYQSAQTLDANANSSNATAVAGGKGLDGTIDIKPGDRLALMPRHLFKAWGDWRAGEAWSLGANMTAVSNILARGNENGQHQPDGTYYLGAGRAAGWAVFNLTASYRATPQWQWFGVINNVFDRRYATAAQLGPMAFTANGSFQSRPFGGNAVDGYPIQHSTFYAPGAPRALWLGMRMTLDKPVRD